MSSYPSSVTRQARRHSDDNSTLAETVDKKLSSESMKSRSSFESDYTLARSSFSGSETYDYAFSEHLSRKELNDCIGPDLVPPSTDICSLPCAGIRIGPGFRRLSGLLAWRLVVLLEPMPEFSHSRRSIVTNFILDTGSVHSPIPLEALEALGYQGIKEVGTVVAVNIQGISMRCTIARPGEAGRLNARFLRDLTFYFDSRLDAPVLYADDTLNRPEIGSIFRTIEPARKSLKAAVNTMFSRLNLSLKSLPG
ncbi:hypothetical protein C8J56DRAFT_926102 [Mycena floridula]|nr:hypothetical protein C8J56DRAFT_926102 [Mycena floridula]